MNMLDLVKFKYCPRCGEAHLQPNDGKSCACRACGFVYYRGTAVHDDISTFELVFPGEIDPAKIAFESHRAAIERYRKTIQPGDL